MALSLTKRMIGGGHAMLRLKKAGLVVCEAVMVFIVIGIVLSGNVEAGTYKFVFKIPSQQWFFSNPSGVAVDSSGNVYVADTGNNRIQKFDSSGGFIAKWGSSGSGDGQFSYPSGVAVDSSGNVYVADTSNQRIQKFNSSGGFITKWGLWFRRWSVFQSLWSSSGLLRQCLCG